MSSKEVDVVVVGAGISGLSAAFHLHKKDPGLKILVLEAKERVGGRTLTVPIHSKYGTDYWDVGAQWVADSQTHIMELIKELGLETYSQFSTGSKFMQLGGDRITSYKSDIPSLSVLALIDLQLFIMKVDRLAKQLDPTNTYNCEKAAEWDSTSCDTFINQSMWTRAAKDTVYAAMRTTFTVEPSQTSLLYFLHEVVAANGILRLFECTGDAAQSLKVKGGTQQISKLMARKIGEKNVLLNTAVSSITQDEDKVTVECWSGLTVRAQRVIVAMPPAIMKNITFKPSLPHEKIEIQKRLVCGNYIKIIVTYKQAFWRENKNSGEIVTYGGPSKTDGCETGPLSCVFDGVTPKKSPALVVFISGYQAIQWGKKDPQERRNAVLNSLADFLGEEAKTCIAYHEMDWRDEPYIEGCVYSMGTGGMYYYDEGTKRPFERVHFAGAEAASVWTGYMSGGVQSGQRAANEVLFNIKPRLLRPQESEDVLLNSYRKRRWVPLMPRPKSSNFTSILVTLIVVVFAVFYFYYSDAFK